VELPDRAEAAAIMASIIGSGINGNSVAADHALSAILSNGFYYWKWN